MNTKTKNPRFQVTLRSFVSYEMEIGDDRYPLDYADWVVFGGYKEYVTDINPELSAQLKEVILETAKSKDGNISYDQEVNSGHEAFECGGTSEEIYDLIKFAFTAYLSFRTFLEVVKPTILKWIELSRRTIIVSSGDLNIQIFNEKDYEKALELLSTQEVSERNINMKTTGENGMTTVLFLSADPTDASRLRLGEELREIQEKLQLSKLRDTFRLEQRMSVRPVDISQALLDVQPQIVHFSGHGTSSGALCFENQSREIHPIEPDVLAALFEQFSNHVSCVLLNACYSEKQSKAISVHIDYVIGMNQAIGDKAAIAFAIGFYQALGGGRTVEDAYKLGCVQLRLQNIPEHLTPVLNKKEQI
jgi:hypothetical protein